MPTIALVARTEFSHHGHDYVKGEVFELRGPTAAVEAVQLITRERARLAPVAARAKPKRGQYRRRDLVPEP